MLNVSQSFRQGILDQASIFVVAFEWNVRASENFA